MIFFLDSILYSYSQIFFSNRRWFGLTIMLATFIMPEMGFLGLTGVIFTNRMALALKFDRERIRKGFYGFNGILIGTATSFFFVITPFIFFLFVVFVVITFFVATSLEHFLASMFNLPGLSLPFIFSLFIFFIFLTNYSDIYYKGFEFVDYDFLNFIPLVVDQYFKSFALIVFQTSIISGIIFSLAILFFSRVMFVNSVLAFTINYILLSYIFPDFSETLLIFTSFNSILAAFALGGSLIILSRKTLPLIVLSSLMIIIFTGFFLKLLATYFLPILVLPFNFVVLATIYSLKFRQEHSDLVLLYFNPGSPEENYYYHQNRKSRFEKFKNLFPELPFFGEWKISQGIEGDITHKDDWKYAWDFIITDEDDQQNSGTGNALADYFCYNTPVAAPLDGEVAKIIDHIQDNEVNDVNIKNNWGNTIVMDHGEGLYSALSHLKPDSIKVKKGDDIEKGKIVGFCGNSGRSPVPHLHFQFQLSDKIGARTYEFPIAHYLESKGDELQLKTFNYPEENTKVRNIEIHKSLKKAFDFKLGDKYEINASYNEKEFKEEWEIKVDIFNRMYIENDKKDMVYLYPQEKVFYFTSYIGNKESALFFFYLSAIKIPLGFNEKLKWNDEIPISQTTNNLVRYISEFLLLFTQQIYSKADFKFIKQEEGTRDIQVETTLKTSGKGIFSFYNEEGNGKLVIDKYGDIKEYLYTKGNNKFSAEINFKKEEQI